MRSIIKTPFYYWKEELSPTLCKAIIEEGKKLELIDASIHTDKTVDTQYRVGQTGFFPKGGWVESIVATYVQKANHFAGWNFILEGAEKVQFGIYNKDAYYKWHRDCSISGDLYRKLSITIQLSNPKDYEGGKFEIKNFWNTHELPLEEDVHKQGTIIVFPSILMHQVTKVTRGTRYSLVQWYNGPDFI